MDPAMPGECPSPGEGPIVLAGDSIPQPDGKVITPTSKCASIRAERDAINISRMPREQGNFGAGVCTIEPNTDPTCDRETNAIWRIRDITRYLTFTKARFGTFR